MSHPCLYPTQFRDPPTSGTLEGHSFLVPQLPCRPSPRPPGFLLPNSAPRPPSTLQKVPSGPGGSLGRCHLPMPTKASPSSLLGLFTLFLTPFDSLLIIKALFKGEAALGNGIGREREERKTSFKMEQAGRGGVLKLSILMQA